MTRRWTLVRTAGPDRAPLTLDDEQERVAAHTRGPLLVRGAAGTGKTSTLVHAVTRRIAEGTDPQRILVLTFSRRGADSLRQEIEGLIGGQASSEPVVRTFPAYAYGLLRRSSVLLGEPPPRLLSAPEQDLMIRELLAGGPAAKWPEALQPALETRAFAEQLRDLLLRAAERGVGPNDPLWRHREDWIAASRFLNEYQETMALRDASTRGSIGYDPAELVRAAVHLLDAEPSVLEHERAQIDFLYVDELADTDPAQIELLKRIAYGKPLIAFGDPNSSVFAFRGADPTIVRTFADQFPGAQQTALTTRHRGDAVTETFALRTRASEAAYVAQRLRQAHLADGVPWSRMAVIMRAASHQLSTYERALRQAGVPAVIHAEDFPVHQQPAVKPFLLLLRCALYPDQLTEETAITLLHSPLGGIDPLGERRLRQGLRALAGPEHASGDLIVDALKDPTELVALDRRWAAPAVHVAGLLKTARETVGTAEEVLWAVWRQSGLADKWTGLATKPAIGPDQQRRAEAADRDLDAIMVLFDAAARFTDRLPGARIETFLDHVLGEELPFDSRARRGERGEAVRLLTAHAAKGLEWDFVVVAGVQEGIWPDLRLRGSLLGSEQLVDEVSQRANPNQAAQRIAQTTALLREERRLFHVAVTRARQRVLITAVDSGAVGGADGEDRPSRFLHELTEVDDGELSLTRPQRPMTLAGLVAELRVAAVAGDEDAVAELARLAQERVPGAHPTQWWGLPELSDDRPLRGADEKEPVRVTPSTMESALRCGLRWLLEKHGGSAPSTAAQGVGNLVHAAAMLADEASKDPTALVEYVAARFDAIELAARWLTGRERERADQMIAKLTRWLAENPRRLVDIEREFSVRLDATPPIELTGRVDRLEVDEFGNLVVIDLKTGKTTTAAASELPEHPQLGAYQVAVEEGAFDEGDVSGGAALVQLGTTHKDAKEQSQIPLRQAEDPRWAHEMVYRTADTMAASTFAAKANDSCRVCPVKSSCPVSGKGRQVVEP
ncbi:ATP-dependent helicase [Catelliglobosispora koreensis]|uniref:ATP-dependent helicase n=1 Tax=Catelliglobosispora koreensis TaxID=129052 RepID=UPI00035CA3D2|nr:ATP-dependent DNA helicase [Catelliglobosispora koreensis]